MPRFHSIKLFFSCVVLTSLMSQSVALAQTPPPAQIPLPTPAPNLSFKAPATVYVINVKLDKTDYKSAEAIQGSFQLSNASNQSVSDIYYHVSLVGNFDANKLPTIGYDQETFGPIFLRAFENKKIDFEYIIQEGIAGDLGIHVDAFLKTGFPLGWSQEFMHISGVLRYAIPKNTSLVVEGKEFRPQMGPPLYMGQEMTYQFSLFNPSSQELSLTPLLTFYKRNPVPPSLKSYKEQEIVLKPKETKTIRFKLPTFDYEPSVYVGNIEFLTPEGKPGGPFLEFRYIVMGDVLGIDSVTSEQTSIKKGEKLRVVVAYTPPPSDISQNTKPKIGDVTMHVKVSNENNQLVGEKKEIFNIDEFTTNSRTIDIKAKEDGNALSIEVQLLKGDKILAEHKTNLPPKLEIRSARTTEGKTNIYYLLLLVLLIAGVAVWLLKKKLDNEKVKLITITLAVLFLLIVSAQIILRNANAGGSYTPTSGFVDSCDGSSWKNGVPTKTQPLKICFFYGSQATIANPTTNVSWTVQDEYRTAPATPPPPPCTDKFGCPTPPPRPPQTQVCTGKFGTECTYYDLVKVPTTCTISGGPYSNTPITSSVSVPVPDEGISLSLRCSNNSQSASESTSVGLIGTLSGGGSVPGCTTGGVCAWVSPNPGPAILSPGQHFCVGGTITAMYCANGSFNGSNVFQYLGQTYSYPFSVSGGTVYGNNVAWSYPSFQFCAYAPAQEGIHYINMTHSSTGSLGVSWGFKVKAPQPTIASFSASPTLIVKGNPTYLSWSSSNATSCSITGIGNVATSRSSYPVYPTQDTTYILTCSNAAGTSAPSSQTVQVLSIGSFSAAPPVVPKGGYVSFSWSSNATSCSLSPVGTVPTNANNHRVYPTQDTTYTLTCSRGGLSVSSTPFPVKVLVIDSFTGGPPTILQGGQVNFSWSSRNATSCSLSPVGAVPTSANPHTLTPTQDSTTYSLTCSNGGVSYTFPTSVIIKILSIPIFSISPTEINRGQSAILTWITKNAISCTASSNPTDSGWSGPKQVGNNSGGLGSQRSQSVTPPPSPLDQHQETIRLPARAL